MENIEEFLEMWKNGEDNYIMENNGTEIRADEYEIITDKGKNSIIDLYYMGEYIAEILLKHIKTIY